MNAVYRKFTMHVHYEMMLEIIYIEIPSFRQNYKLRTVISWVVILLEKL